MQKVVQSNRANTKRGAIFVFVGLGLLIAWFPSVAGEHDVSTPLIKEIAPLASFGSYGRKLRRVFSTALNEDVLLAAFVVPSNGKEQVVGLRIIEGRAEAFLQTVSHSIWGVDLIDQFESETLAGGSAVDGATTLAENKTYQYLLATNAKNISEIEVNAQRVAVSSSIAKQIAKAFLTHLSDLDLVEENRIILDGTTYHFRVQVQENDALMAYIRSPALSTPGWRLAEISLNLIELVKAKANIEDIDKRLGGLLESLK